MVPEGKSWTKEITKGAHVCVVHIDSAQISTLESDLRVGVNADVGHQPQIAIQIESNGGAAAVHPYQPVSNGQRGHGMQIGVAQEEFNLGSAEVPGTVIRHGHGH